MDKHSDMSDATMYAFKMRIQKEKENRDKFRKHHYWRGLGIGIFMWLLIGALTIAEIVYIINH